MFRFQFLSWSETQRCCIPESTPLPNGWSLVVMKVLSTAEIVLAYKAAGFFQAFGAAYQVVVIIWVFLFLWLMGCVCARLNITLFL